MWSYWEREYLIGKPEFTVIGSGIVGLNAAIRYKNTNPHSSVMVIESGVLPTGASTKNAGFACFGSTGELISDIEKSGLNVFEVVEKRWKGLLYLRALLGDAYIEYQHTGGYELFRDVDTENYAKCLDSIPFLNSQLKKILEFEPYSESKEVIKSSGFKGLIGAIKNNEEGLVNTGKMMGALLKKCQDLGITILNGISVIGIEDQGNRVHIELTKGSFYTQSCLVATNGFARKLLPEIDVNPARAQVLITDPIENLRFEGCFHIDNGFYYFRNVGKRVLFGGGRNLALEEETTDIIELNTMIQNELDDMLTSIILPESAFKVEQRWAGIMGIGENKKPVVQKLSENVGCAVKLGGMGIAIGSLIGQEGADLF